MWTYPFIMIRIDEVKLLSYGLSIFFVTFGAKKKGKKHKLSNMFHMSEIKRCTLYLLHILIRTIKANS
jgi:hypothetical protein